MTLSTRSLEVRFDASPIDDLVEREGTIVAFWRGADDTGEILLGAAAEKADQATEGQVRRALNTAKSERGEMVELVAPHGMKADRLLLVCRGLDKLEAVEARPMGGRIAAKLMGSKAGAAHLCAEAFPAELAAEFAMGAALRAYGFQRHKSKETPSGLSSLSVGAGDLAAAEAAYAPLAAVVEGVSTTRDLVNEPANVLTPETFAVRAAELSELGVEIEVMDEDKLAELKMNALLAVGRGSRKHSRVVVMRWSGASDAAASPVALIGKGVTFDTGGVSLKPPAGMEEMTMDMGGAGVVVGAMKAIALRKSKANVVGVIGLVENMPDGDAQRPGDIVTSMSGKTIEVINTDAEGRLVLADLLTWTQANAKPRAMVDLATLTGAMIIALGHEKAGFFANDDAWAAKLAAASDAEGEGTWRLPLGDAYDKMLKSRLADMKNVGGRAAGSITAAQFLQRFVEDGDDGPTPWAHIDIAGVCLPKESGALFPKGPSGWGVATLVRLVESEFEG
ncbi:MAG: leucyl aminopeptidase [Pseudomonadota bacterium]